MAYELPLFPLNTVLFPGMALPLHIFESRYKLMIQHCLTSSTPFGIILLKSGRAEGPLGEIYDIGTTAQITIASQLSDERYNIITVGHRRFRVLSTHHEHPYLTGIVEDFPLEGSRDHASINTAKQVAIILTNYLKTIQELGKLDFELRQFPTDPESLAFLTAIVLPLTNEEKQDLLSISDTHDMLKKEYQALRHEVNILRILSEEPEVLQDEFIPFSFN